MISAPSSTRLLRALLRALRAAAIVLDQKLDVRVLEFRQRHLGGVLHRLRGDAGIAGRRQRQDQPDLDLAVAGDGRLLRRTRPAPVGARVERIGELAQTLLDAGAGRSSGAPSTSPSAVAGSTRSGLSRPEDSQSRMSRVQHRISSLCRTAKFRPERDPRRLEDVQAYCRRTVNQNKRIMASPAGPRTPILIIIHCTPHERSHRD